MKKLATNIFLLSLAGLLSMPVILHAQRQVTVSNFSLPGEFGADTVSLDSFLDQQAVVVVFTSYHCSWSVKYMDRLTQLFGEYQDQDVSFIAINSNDPELEGELVRIAPPVFPFLKDVDQAVAKEFGATKNPEAFVLVPSGNQFKIAYQGKIDDNPLDASLVRSNFLQDALDLVIAGEKVETKLTPASGCSIKGLE